MNNPIAFWILWFLEGVYYLWIIFSALVWDAWNDLCRRARRILKRFALFAIIAIMATLAEAQTKVSACVLACAPQAIGARYGSDIAAIPGIQFEDRIKWFTAQIAAGYDVSGNAPFVSLRMGAAFGHADGFMVVAYPFPYMNVTPQSGYTSPFGLEIRWKNMLCLGVEYLSGTGGLYPTGRFSYPIFSINKRQTGALAGHPAHF